MLLSDIRVLARVECVSRPISNAISADTKLRLNEGDGRVVEAEWRAATSCE